MYPSLTTFPGDLFAEFDAMQRQLNQLFGAGDWPSSIRATARGAFPAVNMGTTEDAVEIYAFAPGLDPAKLDVTIEKGLLSISGERRLDTPGASGEITCYADERFEGPFRRVVGLPDEVDPSRIEATYRDGVLRIVVPKREAMKPRRIEVKDVEKLEHRQ
jgi:HSP20 family protein